MSCRRSLFFVLFCVAARQCLGSRHLFQSPDPKLSSLPSELTRLTEEDALEGVLKENELVFGFSVVRKNNTYPEVLLSLEVFNPAANADIACAPFNVSGSALRFHWNSANAQGIDYVFISTNSPYYPQAITDNFNGVAEFECTLKHVSHEDPVYFIEMDVSYSKREMRKVEQEAMEEIYDSCCQAEGSCGRWNELLHSVELEESNATRQVTDFDFCHVASNVCDEEGYLLKLTMDTFGLECPFPMEQMSKFERLRKLSITGNLLGGNILDIAEALKHMKYLDEVALSYNRLTGALGKEIEDRTNNPLCILARRGLKHLHLKNNDIKGPLPECLLSDGSHLRDLILDGNPISGPIPDSIAKASDLEVISIRDGNLTGTFPESFVYADNLVLVDLSNNQMEGELPDEFGPSPKLRNLFLSRNRFTGNIPSGIAASDTLQSVRLEHNAFTGMPNQWLKVGPATPLINLDVSFNKIEEDFPVVLALLPNLSRLHLNDNKFHGPLPTLSDMFPNAWVLNMSNNAFAGSLPTEWTMLGMFKGTATELNYVTPVLDISFNKLTGRVPDFFFNIDNFPKKLLASATVNFEGNSFNCPERGTSAHLNGFEHCTEEREPIFGESVFDVSRNGGQPNALGADTGERNQGVALTGEDDQETSASDSRDSSSNSDDDDTVIIVVSIVSAALLLSVLLAIAMRFKMYHLAKKAMGAPSSDVEIAAVKHEPLESSKELEEARLRAGAENSESNPL